MTDILNDVEIFCRKLFLKHNIQMFQQSLNRDGATYLGECFSLRGEHFLISIVVKRNEILVRVINVTGLGKTCVFQKAYTVLNNKNTFSKSVSLDNFLTKTLYS